jgi:hypothetical protein
VLSQSQFQTQQGRDAAQFQLRLPDDLKQRIQSIADASGRSINSEIVATLLERFSPDGIAARAAVVVASHILGASDDLERLTRSAEVDAKMRALDPRASVTLQDDFALVLRLSP